MNNKLNSKKMNIDVNFNLEKVLKAAGYKIYDRPQEDLAINGSIKIWYNNIYRSYGKGFPTDMRIFEGDDLIYDGLAPQSDKSFNEMRK
jgi:hypothetical protein